MPSKRLDQSQQEEPAGGPDATCPVHRLGYRSIVIQGASV